MFSGGLCGLVHIRLALFYDIVVVVCNVDAAEAVPGFASPSNLNLLVVTQI